MSVFDGKRLGAETFKLDVERMRRGWYSDKYFDNIVTLLTGLVRDGYTFAGHNAALEETGLALDDIHTGDIEVEMQWFTRRQPFSVIVGVDKALAMLRECTGHFDSQGEWVSTYDALEVTAVQDGFIAPYGGDPNVVTPVLKVRGRYRDFAPLETPTLGALTRNTRVATNVYEVLHAARGKEVLFFPARFDAHEVQAGDGYAYHIAVQLFNQTSGHSVTSAVSTDEQGDWWGGAGGGTVAHVGFLKTWPKNFASMDRGLAEVGFTHWAEGHRYDAYVTFLLWQEWGRSPASLAEQFFKPDAKQPVKVTDAARKAILDPLAQGEKPKFEQAVKEVTKIVDTILIPMYRKEDGKAVEKRIAEEQAELAKKVGELKKLQAP